RGALCRARGAGGAVPLGPGLPGGPVLGPAPGGLDPGPAGGVPRLLPRDHHKGSLYPMNRTRISLTAALLSLCMFLSGCMMPPAEGTAASVSLEDIPAYAGDPYVVIDDNQPDFPAEDLTSTESFETYSPLDALGRCGAAYANVGQDLMPTEDRGSISS